MTVIVSGTSAPFTTGTPRPWRDRSRIPFSSEENQLRAGRPMAYAAAVSRTAVLQGVRILEVAEHTFVPAASALLADWGAEVIKIEPVERGDAMRGLASTGTATVP